MNKLRVVFFFGLLGVVIAIARCNSRPDSQAESPTLPSPAPNIVAATPTPTPTPVAVASPAPSAQPSIPPSPELQQAAQRVTPAVVLISAFDQTGKLLKTATGCFISEDGRFITTSSLTQGASNAVAKTSDGGIYNVSGILTDASALDIAVLKAESKKSVAFLSPNKSAPVEVGTRIAVIGSPLTRRKPAHFEGAVSARRSDQSGDWLELSTPIPNECVGAPVVNEKGELIGVVTSQRGQGEGTNVVRITSAIETLVARIDPRATIGWLAAQGEAPPPAVGPTPPPKRFAEIPMVRADQPGNSKLIYSPKPAYPTAARHSYFPLKGNGRYRVTFTAAGQVKNVEIIESARSSTLDDAATQALRKWKAAPGREWSATVPVSFQP